jgi:rSAM/selenodomain-associated transferase 1
MKTSHPKTVVAIFVRHPVPGRVKTRLARDLGDAAACELYRAMVSDCIVNVRDCGLPLFLFHDGQASAGLPSEWTGVADAVFRQEGESLGERMRAAFERSFSAGATGVILIGSDIPGLDSGLLRSAQAAVELYDIVLSPAFDGGYCLVASKRMHYNNGIFQGIPWSTARVLELTLAASAAHGLSCHLLETCQDIDTLDDIKNYCRHPSPHATFTNTWLVSHGYIVPPVNFGSQP